MNKKKQPTQTKLQRFINVSVQKREADPNAPTAQNTLTVVLATEYPVERYDWWTDTLYSEILDCSPTGLNTERSQYGLPLLIDHNTASCSQVGLLTNVRSENINGENKILADVVWSRNESAQEIKNDVEDGIRTNMSVGYFVNKYDVDETTTPPTVRVSEWTAYEGSWVVVGADPKAGVGRSKDSDFSVLLHGEKARSKKRAEEDQNPEDSAETPEEQSSSLDTESETEDTSTESQTPAEPAAESDTTTSETEDQTREEGEEEDDEEDAQTSTGAETRTATDKLRNNPKIEIIKNERVNMSKQIIDACKQYGVSESTTLDFVSRGLSLDQVKDEILKTRSQQPTLAGLSAKDKENVRKKYSYARAFAVAYDKEGKLDGLEGEVSSELAKRSASTHGGFFVPHSRAALDHTLETGDFTNDPAFLQSEVSGDLIQAIRTQTTAIANGATLIENLTGEYKIPRFDGDTHIEWVTENPTNPFSVSDLPVPSLVTLFPKMAQATHRLTVQQLRQGTSIVNGDKLIRDNVANAIAQGVDIAAYKGTGQNGTPRGLMYTSGTQVYDFDGNAPTFSDLINMYTKIYVAMKQATNPKFVATPELAGYLSQTLTSNTTAAARYLWEGDYDNGVINGYKARVAGNLGKFGTNSDEQGFILGLWDNLLIGLGGSTEIVIDPYTYKRNAIIEYTAYTFADVAVKRPEAFVVANGLKIPS